MISILLALLAQGDMKSAGALAFGPDGVLFVGDSVGGAIYAVETGDEKGDAEKARHNVQGLDLKVAAALGVQPADIRINDLAINPASGNAFLSVSRGKGPDAAAVILKLDGAGKLSQIKDAKTAKAELPSLPTDKSRADAITDLAFVNGNVIVAGLSNEEFASNLRSIPYPFKAAAAGTGVEIYHGAHGKFETKSPVRTFAVYEIGKESHVLAAYTCTPLVRFPLESLKPGAKIKGTTVAELGNRNRPLDMIVYQQGGKDFVLMANNNRGVMKISTDGIATRAGITERISDKAGQAYETIDALKGVVQLDRLNKGHAVVLAGGEAGPLNLSTIALP